MSVVLLLLMAFSVVAQDFQYRAEGSFPTTSGPGTPGTPSSVNYSVSWNETATNLQGLYRDNFFTQAGPSIVTGTVTGTSRSMKVIFPEAVNGVKSISLTSNQKPTANQPIPMKIVTANNEGATIDSPPVDTALLTAINDSVRAIDIDNCDAGFGALRGFCGLYDGQMNESADTANRCNLLTAGNPRLELGEDTVVTLFLNYIPGAVNQSSHTIGALPPTPGAPNVNITSRSCVNLPGTTFETGDCHTLNLTGDFAQIAGSTPRFVGTYTITDDVNGESCSYTMSLSRSTSL